MRFQPANLHKQEFGSLVADCRAEGIKDAHGHAYWICYCDCGGVAVVRANNLISGNTTSCGCVKKKGRPRR